MMKKPHPSGRPIRKSERKYGRINWNYPAETYATPRLRSSAPQSVYAVATTRIEPTEDWVGAWADGIGFIRFK